MWSNHIHLNIKKSITKCVFKYYLTQVYSESQRLYMFLMPSYLQLSFQLPPITSVLALLFIHNFFFFSPLFPLPLLICLLLLYYISSVVYLCGTVSFLCSSISVFLPVTSLLFYSPLLTFPQFLVLPLSSHVFSIPVPPLLPTPSPRCSPILWM